MCILEAELKIDVSVLGWVTKSSSRVALNRSRDSMPTLPPLWLCLDDDCHYVYVHVNMNSCRNVTTMPDDAHCSSLYEEISFELPAERLLCAWLCWPVERPRSVVQ